MQNLLKKIIHRPIALFSISLALITTAFFAIFNIPIELIPSVDYPELYIITYWPGSSPQSIESEITSLLEAEFSSIDGIRKILSESLPGVSRIILKINPQKKLDFVKFKLNERISFIIDKLPEGVYPPRIIKYEPEEIKSKKLLIYHITGPYNDAYLRNIAKKKIIPIINSIPGVAGTEVSGGRDRQILISIKTKKLKTLNISLANINHILYNANIIKNIGSFIQNRQQYNIIVKNNIKTIYDIGLLPVSNYKGHILRLRDIANIKDTLSPAYSYERINLNPAILITIQKSKKFNSIRVANNIYKTIKKIKKQLPKNISIIKEEDSSVIIRKNMKKFFYRSFFSFIIILLILILFLKHLSSALIVQFSIIFSILITFLMMFIFKMTVNIITFAGLTLGFGIFVDNSIIVLENIYRYKNLGAKNLLSCTKGPSEIILPVIASTLTTISVLIPFLYMMEELKIYYLPFAITVSISLLTSLLIAFFFIPAAEYHISKFNYKIDHISKEKTKFSIKFESIYEKILKNSLKKPVLTLLIVIWIFGIPLWKLPLSLNISENDTKIIKIYKNIYNSTLGSEISIKLRPIWEHITGGAFYLFNRYVKKGELWNSGEENYIRVYIKVPEGTDINQINKIAKKFEYIAASNNGISKINTSVYNKYAIINIYFTKNVNSYEIPFVVKTKLTLHATNVGNCNISIIGYGPIFFTGNNNYNSDVKLILTGYNYYDLIQLAKKIKKKLLRYPRVKDVQTNLVRKSYLNKNNFEQLIKLDHHLLSLKKLNAYQVSSFLNPYISSYIYNQKLQVGLDEINFNIKVSNYDSLQFYQLKNLEIVNHSTIKTKLKDIAKLTIKKVEPTIERENQKYYKVVSFKYLAPENFVDRFVKNFLRTLDIPPGYNVKKQELFSLNLFKEKEKNIMIVLLIALLLMYIILAGLYESFLYPLLIFIIIPLSLIGVFLIYYITNRRFDQSSYIGIIFLFGIVVNNAIVLLDHINLLKKDGNFSSFKELLIHAGKDRARPVLMTMITTVAGLSPMLLLDNSNSSDIWYNLALSTTGGLISSTLLGLIILPIMVYLIEKIKIMFKYTLKQQKEYNRAY